MLFLQFHCLVILTDAVCLQFQSEIIAKHSWLLWYPISAESIPLIASAFRASAHLMILTDAVFAISLFGAKWYLFSLRSKDRWERFPLYVRAFFNHWSQFSGDISYWMFFLHKNSKTALSEMKLKLWLERRSWSSEKDKKIQEIWKQF